MIKKHRQKVYSNLPNTGLGNKMLVWAKAYVFSKTHNLELFNSPWSGIHCGSWFRKEKYKRVYFGYFTPIPFFTFLEFIIFRIKALHIREPKNILNTTKNVVYVFNEIVSSSDYFQSLKSFRNDIQLELYKILNKRLLKELEKYPNPEIGIHVRRGDFKLGSTITPESFFVSSILTIRKTVGIDLSVEVFTDAFIHEIPELLALPNVYITKPKAAILDILLLSRSKICILSIGSTFSFWAAFLSNGIVLRHPNEWHPLIRPKEINEICYEANFDPFQIMDNRLIDHLKKIDFARAK